MLGPDLVEQGRAIAPSSPGRREALRQSSDLLAEQGLEFAPSHVFRQLRKLDIAADAALRADGELVDRQMLGRPSTRRRRKSAAHLYRLGRKVGASRNVLPRSSAVIADNLYRFVLRTVRIPRCRLRRDQDASVRLTTAVAVHVADDRRLWRDSLFVLAGDRHQEDGRDRTGSTFADCLQPSFSFAGAGSFAATHWLVGAAASTFCQ